MKLPKMAAILAGRGRLVIPLFVIIFFLVRGFTPLYAALVGLVVCVLAAQLRKSTRVNVWDVLDRDQGRHRRFHRPLYLRLQPGHAPHQHDGPTLTRNLVTAILGMVGIGAAMIGCFISPMRSWERLWFVVAGLMLIDPGRLSDVIGDRRAWPERPLPVAEDAGSISEGGSGVAAETRRRSLSLEQRVLIGESPQHLAAQKTSKRRVPES